MGQAGTPNAKKCVWEPDPPYKWVQLRQTNPIPAGPAGWVHGREKRAKQTQFGPGEGVPARPTVQNKPNLAGSAGGLGLGGRTCETKPVSEDVLSVKCQVLSRRSQRSVLPAFLFQTLHFRLHTAAEPPDGMCETKPISPLGLPDGLGIRRRMPATPVSPPRRGLSCERQPKRVQCSFGVVSELLVKGSDGG